ncbi:hypothetical protein [Micromonospora sp. NPDC050200]|uniref:hypothetical protein n=1 Tax=Micromonospora sp. NPDC050200 TaxID=3155664 RepID=UPI0033CB6D50
MELHKLFDAVLAAESPDQWSKIPIWGSDGGPVGLVGWREQVPAANGRWHPRIHTYHFVNKDQVELALAWGYELNDDDDRESTPEWAERFPLNKQVHPFYADILWNGSPVYRTLLWGVDQRRGYVPDPEPIFRDREPGEEPELERYEASSTLAQFADLLKSLAGPRSFNTYDYCRQADVKLVDRGWF